MSPARERSRPLSRTGPATNINLTASLTADRPLERVLERLERVRRSGKGWTARCPAHEDKFPSLSVSEGADGRVLLHDHAGCSVEEIVRALGLTTADLFPPRPEFPRRRGNLRRRRTAPIPRDTLRALAWRRAFTLEWEVAKALAPLPAPLAQRDLLAGWSFLDSLNCDPAFTWRVTCLIRGVALLNYSTTADSGDVARAVRRLLRDVDSAGDVVA